MSSVWSTLEGGVVGVAVGTAAAAAVEPSLEPERQEAWKQSKARILELRELAALVAQALQTVDDVLDDAERNGYAEDQLLAAIQLALRAPPYAEVLDLWRRGKFGTTDPASPPEQVTHAFAKAGIEHQYWEALGELFYERLSAQDVAVMVQRNVARNPGWLPNQPSTEGSNVPPMPQAKFDPVAEARSQGYDEDRASALAKIIGLPASLDLAARMHFRDIINEAAYNQAVLEGNTRGEWAPFLLDGFREILTANQYSELQLRGFYDEATRRANTAKHGMSDEDSDLLYDVLGRSIAVHAVTTGLARGGKYPGSYDNVPEPYKSAIQRSNIREEWSELAYANRYSYPSGFQIKSEAQKGDLTADETNELLLEVGWAPKWARFFADKWAPSATATPTVSTKAEQAKAIRSIGSSYSAVNITLEQAKSDLAPYNLPSADLILLFDAWAGRREAKLQGMSNAQIRNAYKKQAITIDEALARLEAHGLTAADAQIYLAGDLTQLTDDQIREQYKAGLVTLDAALAILEARGMTAEAAQAYLSQ